MTHAHGGEIGKQLHHAAVVLIERLLTTVGHDEDWSPRLIDLPWKQDAIGYEWRLNPHQFKEPLSDPKELWLTALQTDAAGARVARKNGVQKMRVSTGGCDPMVEVFLGPIFLFDTDTSAVGITEFDSGVHQLLQDCVRIIDEGTGNPPHPFHLHRDVSGMYMPRFKSGVTSDVNHFKTGIRPCRSSRVHMEPFNFARRYLIPHRALRCSL